MRYSGAGQIYKINETANPTTYSLAVAFAATFNNAVDIRNGGDSRLFVVEQQGFIRVFDTGNPQAPATFLDIDSEVTSGGERGLLGLAFHPNYSSNGTFFVYYTENSGSVAISRFNVSGGDPNVADAGSEARLLTIPQQFSNHNGGGLAFDGNGYLLVAVGDEGSGGDPNDNAQDRTTLHGSILRLDVNVPASPFYQIPPDNPFAGNSSGYAEEIFAWGMRNPWRISYDATTDRIWVGDVGQRSWEEVDVIVNGGNYGWDCLEGTHDFIPAGSEDGPSPVCAGVNP
jgi:glucose/arabinose dehydrogenase